VDDVPGLQVAAGRDDGVANGAAADTAALLVYRRAAFRVNGAVSAGSLVQSPVRGGHDRIGVLVGDVADDEGQFRWADGRLHETRSV